MRPLFNLVAALVIIFIAAPLLIVLPMSLGTSPSLAFPPPGYGLQNFARFFADPSWTGPVVNSFVIALCVTVVTLALVTPACFAMVRHRFRGHGLINLLLLVPFIVPHIVMAIGYYLYFGPLRLVQTYLGVVLAHSCLAVPIAFLTVSAALKGFDRSLERAAMGLGATPLETFFLVTLPILRPAFLVAALMAFVSSFDETTVALFISGRDVATLPKKLFDSLRLQADPVVSAASTLLVVIVLVAVTTPLLWRLATKRRSSQAGPAQAAA
ncbi:MAG: ABC transporter permease [Hyphomicrobiales bacterium]